MKMKMIVAIAKNRGIGLKNMIPWRLGADLQYFKKKTIGNGNNAIVIGQNTWLSLTNSSKKKVFLPKRDNIILSKNNKRGWATKSKGDTNFFFSSIHQMKTHCKERKYDEVWIIGGESLYMQTIPDADLQEIHVTEIEKIYKVDTYFPNIPDHFSLLSSIRKTSNDINYSHKVFIPMTKKIEFPRYGGIPQYSLSFYSHQKSIPYVSDKIELENRLNPIDHY